MATLRERIQPALDARDDSLEPSAKLPASLKPLPLDVTSIPQSSGLLSERELDLTENYDATALLELLAAKKVSAVALLTAFRKRATIAQQCTNCLTQLVPGAVDDAKACDDYLAQTGRVKGPLHGLPISFKEQFSMGGLRTNGGFVAWVNNVSQDDCRVVKSLKELGAVIFARTTEPQSLMHLETSSVIYGTTVNPKNRTLTSGGSSGGEGALLAMKGSPFGIGGDIGGSVRVPAALNGLYGLLPTPGRFSGIGIVNPLPGNDAILGTLGPLTRSLRDIETFCRAYSSLSPWIDDKSIIPCDILGPGGLGKQLDPSRPLRVGILSDDGVVSPLPPVRRVLEKIQSRLEKCANIHTKTYVPWDHGKAWRVIAGNYFEDTGKDIRDICHEGAEPLEPLTKWILEQAESNTPFGSTVQSRKVARDAFKTAYAAHWNKSEVDVIIAPTTPSTAPPLGTTNYWGYTAVWNLLSYPVVVLPGESLVGGNSKQGLLNEGYEPKNDIEAEIWKNYSATTSESMPVGIQVVGPRYHESLVFEAARIIEEALDV